jgi:hypothetical protein
MVFLRRLNDRSMKTPVHPLYFRLRSLASLGRRKILRYRRDKLKFAKAQVRNEHESYNFTPFVAARSATEQRHFPVFQATVACSGI